jgi:hypothetical protein
MQALPDAEDRYEKTNEECRVLFLKLNRLDVVALYIGKGCFVLANRKISVSSN